MITTVLPFISNLTCTMPRICGSAVYDIQSMDRKGYLRAQHISYFVVTEGLGERLLASGAARIINTASGAFLETKHDQTAE